MDNWICYSWQLGKKPLIEVTGQHQYIYIIHHWSSLLTAQVMVNCQYLMEAITMLPDIKIFSLELLTRGHAIGPCVFHLLRMSTGIRNLRLKLRGDIEAQTACSSGCICDQPQDWETEDVLLNSLTEVDIFGLRGAGHEFAFAKRLFRWAAVLKTITLTFDPSVSFSKEVSEKLLNLSPGDLHEINFHGDEANNVLDAPV